MIEPSEFGRYLKAKRTSKGLTQEALAESIGKTGQYISNIEKGKNNAPPNSSDIVFTEKAVFIIEVKNPHRDIYIDERGNYCRVGDTMHLDCNIGEKMNEKVYLLREALKSAGYSNANIVSLVVFTNSTMHVDNRYDYITTCFLGNLPHIIERYDGKPIYSDSSISAMMESVSNAECKEAYPLEIDINQYKYRFANLMATLEEAAEKRYETVDTHEAETEEACQDTVSEEVSEMLKSIKKPADKTRSTIVAAVGIAVAFGAGFIASQILGSNRK